MSNRGHYETGQMPLLTTQVPQSSFENFTAVSSNQIGNAELVQSLLQLLSSGEPTPFYLHGVSGSGKTHLLNAALSAHYQRPTETGGPEFEVTNTLVAGVPAVYFDLANPHIQAEQLGDINQRMLICIDNVDAWAGDEHREQGLFALVERVKQGQWPLIVAAKHKPDRVGFALADLVSRLQSGVVYRLEELDDGGKLSAIRMRIKQQGLAISDEALQYLLTHFARDNHNLFKSITQLDKASLIAKRKITIPFMQQVLRVNAG